MPLVRPRFNMVMTHLEMPPRQEVALQQISNTLATTFTHLAASTSLSIDPIARRSDALLIATLLARMEVSIFMVMLIMTRSLELIRQALEFRDRVIQWSRCLVDR